MECKSRFQLCDMGYFECQLDIGHIGDHQYTRNPAIDSDETPFRIIWKPMDSKDLVIDETWLLNNTNFQNVLEQILLFPEITKIEYIFQDDPVHGAVPSIWINTETTLYTTAELEDVTNNVVDIIYNGEHKIRQFIRNHLVNVLDNTPISDYRLRFHIQTLPSNT